MPIQLIPPLALIDYRLTVCWSLWWLLALAFIVVCGVRVHKRPEGATLVEMLAVYCIASVLWWFAAGGFELQPTVRIVSASLCAFAIGSLIGLIFSTYSAEKDDVGKVRDIFLGAVSTLTIADLSSSSPKLAGFLTLFTGDDGGMHLKAVIVSCFIVYGVLGFFAVFYMRKTQWNKKFAQGDPDVRKAADEAAPALNERAKVLIQQRTGDEPPASVVSSPDVKRKALRVANAADDANFDPSANPSDIAQSVARAYVAANMPEKAIYVYQSLLAKRYRLDEVVPELAFALESVGRFKDAARVIEANLAQVGDIGNMLLGYYLLWDRTRLKDAITYSAQFLAKNPASGGAIFNSACAYAQLYAKDKKAQDRQHALDWLEKAITLSPDFYRPRAIKWSRSPDDDFYELRNDPQFRLLIGDAQPPNPTPTPTPTKTPMPTLGSPPATPPTL